MNEPTYPIIGPFEHRCWAGLVFSPRVGCGAAFRLGMERDGTRIDGLDLAGTIVELGPAGVGEPYGRITFADPRRPSESSASPPPELRRPGLIWEWVRHREDQVVARAKLLFPGHLIVTAFFPWSWRGEWAVDGARMTARLEDGTILYVVATGQPTELQPAVSWPRPDDRGAVELRIPVSIGDVIRLCCVLRTGAPEEMPASVPPTDIDEWLTRAHADHESTMTTSTGVWHGLPEAVTNCLSWTTLLQPETGTLYTPAGRKWIFPTAHGGPPGHWTIFAWDSFFNGIEHALERTDLAEATFRAVLDTQYPDGHIPNWRAEHGGTPDRSQPPIGAFTLLKYALRTGDRSLLRLAQPYLERWSDWWSAPKGASGRRQAGPRGLYQWGCDVAQRSATAPRWEIDVPLKQYAAWESGQDDLPHWDEAPWSSEAETFAMDVVDLNCYLALDYECLARIAVELGQAARERAFRAARDDLIARINDHLWDESRGMYVDRYWHGGFSTHVGAMNFLPLLAGVPDRERATTMLERLLDRSFWGPFVVPSVSRDDPTFSDQVYWRGSIWPPLNYLIYQGLRRYRFDDAAAALAARSVDLFLAARDSPHAYAEHYDSRTGEGLGHRFQSWGPLLALMGTEEFIDVTPWDGLRIGTIVPPPDSTLHRVAVAGHSWQIGYENRGLAVACDRRRFATKAPIILRHVDVSASTLRAESTSTETVPLTAPGAAIEIDGIPTPGAAVVPPGEHRILLRWP